MKFKNIYLIVFVLVSAFIMPSCTGYMEDLNIDERQLDNNDRVADGMEFGPVLTSMMNSIIVISPEWQYQLQQNLNADIYSGYMMSGSPFADGNNPQYEMNDGWNGFVLSVPFNNVMGPYLEIKGKNVHERYPDYGAIADLIKILAFHRIVDVFGPLPYKEYGSLTATFDSEETIYNEFFKELDYIVDTLSVYDDKGYDSKFVEFDISSLEGDYSSWIQLANSLRLRLAVRISGVDPVLAKAEGEKAIANSYGLLSSKVFEINHNFNHPLATISGGWNDILMGAPMESYLKGFNDPRLNKFFQKATGDDVLGDYKGIRNGAAVGSDKSYAQYSLLNFSSSDPVLLMTGAESYFLLAEATLLGWNTNGNAQSFYESGVAESFKQYELSGLTEYLNGTSGPAEYIDPRNDDNSVKTGDVNLSTIGVLWSEAATNEEKLERIITQKWIAMFPEGQEAWTEFRRTGYPKLFPLVNKKNDDIAEGEFIKRLVYPSAISSTNPTGVENAVKDYLDGQDKISTPLWWDVD